MTRKRMVFTVAGGLAAALALAGAAGLLVLRSEWLQNKTRSLLIDTVETATGGRAEVGTFHFDWTRLRM